MFSKANLVQVVEGSRSLSYVNYLKGQVAYRLGLRGHGSGGTHRKLPLEESISYIDQVVGDYFHYGGGGSAEVVQGKHILEVGPGDNLGVALELYSRGAASVTAVDGFDPVHDERQCSEIYKALMDRMEPERRRRAQRAVRFDGARAVFDPESIVHRIECPIERADLKPGSYDIVVSRAVMEHVFDVKAAWRSMVRLLSPTGVMWHKIDLRNHNFFEQIHPLEYLTFSESIWRIVSRPDPTLNRALTPVWRALAAEDFHKMRVFFTSVIGRQEMFPHREALRAGEDFDQSTVESVRKIRGRLSAPYREYSDQDLFVNGIFLIVWERKGEARAETGPEESLAQLLHATRKPDESAVPSESSRK